MREVIEDLWPAFVALFAVVIATVAIALTLPCHGTLLNFNAGPFCAECGEPIYHVCECGHKLQGNYCTYCGAENQFMED